MCSRASAHNTRPLELDAELAAMELPGKGGKVVDAATKAHDKSLRGNQVALPLWPHNKDAPRATVLHILVAFVGQEKRVCLNESLIHPRSINAIAMVLPEIAWQIREKD